MFDGNSFKKIKRAKIGGVSYRDKLTAVWFELLDLAGKSNSNGYLIDTNEIPYRTLEDIAIMLDRDEKEIELCMQFFINERMVEIVDDIFCLTNFMQYQNQEGLDKIREQKRLRQARWRERKALGFVDEKTSTKASTKHLPSISISYSNSYSILFDYWNSKEIIVHREINTDIEEALKKALSKYTEEEIKVYIDRYAQVISDKSYFWSYKWSLKDFLNRKDGISAFTDEGSKWNSYRDFLGNPNKHEKQEENPFDKFNIGVTL
jgi:predicted phage replisome organizer